MGIACRVNQLCIDSHSISHTLDATFQNSGDAQLSLTDLQLQLIKQARDLAGTVLSGGTDVSPGQTLYFVIHVYRLAYLSKYYA